MGPWRVCGCFAVTFFVLFLNIYAFGQVQCLFLFDKQAYESLYLPSAGKLISKHQYQSINKLADGVYNFIVLADGSLQIGHKFQGSAINPTKTLASHVSLYNSYLQANHALHKKSAPVVAAGKLILINKQVSQISNINFDFKKLAPEYFMSFVSELKKQGVEINSLTQVKLYPTSTLANPNFRERVQQREIERAHIMGLKNQNPELALLWMNAKQFYQQLYALFPSQKKAGILDLLKLENDIRPFLSTQQKESLFLEILKFLKGVENEGILLSVNKLYQVEKQNTNPIEQFRDTTNFFLKLIEAYKQEKAKNEMQLDLWLTN